ncbi:MAG TPA: alpha-glucosidase [Terriglobales bacterium]|nr:alpha-glucosidase [Terriglobales bacterium]
MRIFLHNNSRAKSILSSAWGVLALVLLGIAMFSVKAKSQVKLDAEGRQWWQHAVFYEIYPRSFADTNNSGIGDLDGITEKLDYLKDLGIDAIWITPCYPSPQVDFGYDVSDYENIDPMYGTLADFDRLASEAKKRNIRIIMDFVMNHTSDQHAWFKESRSSRDNPKRDWYIWRDGKGAGRPPNNWLSTFGGSAWKFDPTTGQWYYHFFYPEQPDLNWRNPEVEKAMFNVTRWWYERGVAGFRLDAVDTLFEDPDLHNNPVLPGKNQYGDPNMQNLYNTKLPELHGVLQRLRQVADKYDAVLIGETWTKDIDELKQYYGEHSNELQMPMDFLFTRVDKLSAPEFRKQIAGVNSAGWPVYVLSNHDIVRAYVRYGDGVHNDAIAKLMAGLYLTLRGTPIMYYGEEIGMTNNDPKRREDVKDPIGRLGWPKEKGRDGERTPMQWNTSANAGFSQTKPWLPVPASYKTHNVATELKDPDSILNFYRRVLALRQQDRALRDGDYVALNENDANVLSYLRRYKDEAVLVVLNMSSSPQKVSFDLQAQGLTASKAATMLSTGKAKGASVSLQSISLDPFAVYIGKVGP